MYPIPANATRIRYLESTGTQYVDTGVIITPQSSVSLDVSFTSISTGAADAQHNGFVKGSDSGNYRTIIGVDNGSKKVYSIGNTLQLSADLNRHVFGADYKNLVVSIDSTTQSISGTFTGSFTRSFYIFARNESGTPALFCHEKLYGAQFWQNGVLVRSFVPVRVGQVGHLFDRVSGQLFGNAGTGDFVLGPDTFSQGVVPTRMMVMGVRKKLPYDAEVEYIEIAGDGAYIDTGVTPRNSPSATIRAQYLGTGKSSAAAMPLFGVRNYSTSPMKAMNFWVQSSTLKLAVNYNGRDTGWQTQTTNTTAFHDFGVSSTGGTYDGTQFVSYSESVADTGLSCLVGAVRQGNVSELVVTRQVKLRIASFQLYNGGVLAFDGRAVRKGTTGYLYDSVSGNIYGNAASSGSFVLGTDK